jgi:hypothetical protein
MHTTERIPVIGPEEKFYGYIIGLGIGVSDPLNDYQDRNLYALFEYNCVRSTWIVPDEKLFKILSKYLCGDAWIIKNTDDHGYNKLWIEQKEGKWIVNLP